MLHQNKFAMIYHHYKGVGRKTMKPLEKDLVHSLVMDDKKNDCYLLRSIGLTCKSAVVRGRIHHIEQQLLKEK